MKTITLLLFTALLASANTVTIELTGTSGVSDGADYVLPYFISINGGPSLSADCYDFFDAVSIGESWTANEYDLVDVIVNGQYAAEPNAAENYELAGILSAQITTSAQDQIDLQHDLWNLFDPGTFTPDAGMTAYLSTASTELGTFNFSNTRYIEGVPGTSPAVQAFVMQDSNARLEFSPEPGSMLLIGIGLLAITLLRRAR